MHWEPNVGLDPGSPGSRPGPKAGAKPLRHPGIPRLGIVTRILVAQIFVLKVILVTEELWPMLLGFTIILAVLQISPSILP